MEHNTTLFDYLTWRGDLTMEQDPMNQIDGMIFARFSYLPFGMVMEQRQDKFVPLAKVADKLLACEDVESHVLYREDLQLLDRMASSARYGNLQIGNYIDLYEEESETQFSAITIKMEDAYCIAYRGTDNTLLGWKEDLNMGFVFPISSQERAKEYLEDFAGRHRGDLILCGHSKGGNVAVYAAAYTSECIQRRIRCIYDYDGPGFYEEALDTEGYARVREKIKTYVPQDSLVGMLLGHLEEHSVVHSLDYGPFQHNVYTWEVTGPDFCYEKDVTSRSHAFDQTLKEWYGKTDAKQRELFVEAIYSLIGNTSAKTLQDLRGNWAENSKIVLNTMRNMDEESKKLIGEGLALFMKCAWEHKRTPRQFAAKKGRKIEKKSAETK